MKEQFMNWRLLLPENPASLSPLVLLPNRNVVNHVLQPRIITSLSQVCFFFLFF